MNYASKVFVGKFFIFLELHPRVVWSKAACAVCVPVHVQWLCVFVCVGVML